MDRTSERPALVHNVMQCDIIRPITCIADHWQLAAEKYLSSTTHSDIGRGGVVAPLVIHAIIANSSISHESH